MKHDMTVGWKQHIKNGNVWEVTVELAMQDEIGPGVPSSVLEYTVMVLVVAPNRDLAQYIVTTMYPEYESISIPDEPYTPD
tara:strand:+ start:553 stop:795 length:243 start_codon:yes stop_codon:yes gene_type:complete